MSPPISGSQSRLAPVAIGHQECFLTWGLEEEVFMVQPPGFCEKGEENKICKLRKSFYGLKQFPRAWFDRFESNKRTRISTGTFRSHNVLQTV